MTPEERQVALEAEMVDNGVERFRRHWAADVERKDVTRQTAIQELLEAQIEPMAQAIDRVREKVLAGKAGRKSVIHGALMSLESEVLAFLTAKAVLNGLALGQAYGTIQRDLGKIVNDEILAQKLAKHDQTAIDWVERECKRRRINTRHHKEKYIRKMAKHRGSHHRDFTSTERIQVGAALAELFIEATGIATVEHVRSGKKTKAILVARPALYDWIKGRNDQLELLSPFNLPMVAPPLFWSRLMDDGGYYTIRVPLVKGSDRVLYHLRDLQKTDTRPLRYAVELLDKTAYRINHRVLNIMERYQELGRTIPGMEKAQELELPPKPVDIETNDEARRDYAKQARAVYDHNASAVSLKLQFERALEMAKRFEEEPKLYFPNQLDFRGRAYPMPGTLNPQGPDFVRALLEFDVAKKIDGEALNWLRVNLANLFGEDKLTLEERKLWAISHEAEILAVANRPLDFKWWEAADKPWQFLAACIDYNMALVHGCSQIRVAMDGSCNGIQHFAAMLLDPVAARAVNLADQEAPRDIYQDVADFVVTRLKLEDDPQKKLWADQFLALGIDRKITKRSVMVMPYGGTFNSTLKYVEEECRSRGYQEAFGDQWFKSMAYLSQLVFDATRTVVKSGADVMGWLQEVAKMATTNKVHLKWTTPVGMVAQQCYIKHESKLVHTYLEGNAKPVRSTREFSPTNRIDPLKSKNGISPNVVHSMDAAAMMMAVNEAAGRGATHFHCIHDDFGTHAADTQCLFEALRSAFVGMYRDEQLKRLHLEFCCQIPDFVPEPPARGTFDIEEVLRSKYFFA